NAVIDASVVAEEIRGYLGASAVGHECLRRIQFDWMCHPEHPVRLRDIFDRGHGTEVRSRNHLVRAGFTFADKDRLQFTALDGMLSGHADGIIVGARNYPTLHFRAYGNANASTLRAGARSTVMGSSRVIRNTPRRSRFTSIFWASTQIPRCLLPS